MTPEETRNLETNGWRFGNYADFLGLSPGQAALIEVKHALRRLLKQRREEAGLTQSQAAKYIGTSQSRYSTMEKGDPKVSVDLLVQALAVLGVTVEGIADALRASKEEIQTTRSPTSASPHLSQRSSQPEANADCLREDSPVPVEV
jgi:transcriptional regulator with XRE-family HTH domain